MFAAIEAGGTKFVCAVGDRYGSLSRTVIPTRDVATTRSQVITFLDAAIARHGPIAGVGIGSFGPLQLDRDHADYGSITATPKPGWQGANLPQWFADYYDVPVAIDTDVNAAALAEAHAAGVHRLAYVTVGTGIGVGLVIDGRPQSGFGHPEAGHLLIRRDPGHGAFPGVCSFHGDCLEGLASGPAISGAWGASLAELPIEHPAWEIEANYLGQLCTQLILTVAPDLIVFGGGVMKQVRLLRSIRRAVSDNLAGYCSHWDDAALATRIIAPQRSEPPGLTGAFLLAERTMRHDQSSLI